MSVDKSSAAGTEQTTPDVLLIQRKGGCLWLTLNRPQRLNALTPELHRALREALEHAETQNTVRAIVITGTGRAFCAGQDLAERRFADGEAPDLGASLDEFYNPLARLLYSYKKPLIAAVNGSAAGAGAVLALWCDIVIAAKSACFIQSFAKIGLSSDTGSAWILPRLVGLPRARAMMLLGEKIDATTAAQWGLIWECVEDDMLIEKTEEIACRLADAPPLAIDAIRQSLREAPFASLNQQLDMERETQHRLGLTDDYREGVQAFMERRKPVFRGR